MKLTVGMACADDFHGAFFTMLNILGDNDWERPEDIEVILVDDSPSGSSHSRELAALCKKFPGRGENVRYVRNPRARSTTQPKDQVFVEAKGDVVCVMDCHVKPARHALERLLKWFEANPNSLDIVSGPLVSDWAARLLNKPSLPAKSFQTHFSPRWRTHMWGVWGTDSRAASIDAEAFEVPGQGTGLFACRKVAWQGFNPNFRGFGGEALYIHEKFRRAGGKALCLPFLRWIHRFGRPDGAKYPLRLWDRVRNYVIGHLELGLDLQPVYEHYVDLAESMNDDELRSHLVDEHSMQFADISDMSRAKLNEVHAKFKMTRDDWMYLIGDPINRISPLHSAQFKSHKLPMPENPKSIDDVYGWMKGATRRDIKLHFDAMSHVAQKCETITEFTRHRESTVVWSRSPAKVFSFTREPDVLLKLTSDLVGDRLSLRLGIDSTDIASIEPTDLLFLNTFHSGERLQAEISAFLPSVKRFLLVSGTQAFGKYAEQSKSDSQQPGMWMPMHQLMKSGWFVVWHSGAGQGMTLFGQQEQDRPKYPQYAWSPGFGAGTELKKILASIGIHEKPNCPCAAFAATMDRWGIDGCIARRAHIEDKLRSNAKQWGWGSVSELLQPTNAREIIGAAWKSVKTGLVFKINPLDPFPGLVEQAIEAEEALFEMRHGFKVDRSEIVEKAGE